MNIIECILKIYPDWRGVVWENDYSKIIPHELEKRPIPKIEEIESAWEIVQSEKQIENDNLLLQEKIIAETRIIAIDSLKKKGKLPNDYKDTIKTGN
jgi:hypothetical protein